MDTIRIPAFYVGSGYLLFIYAQLYAETTRTIDTIVHLEEQTDVVFYQSRF